jgi:tRNA pseudouridine38-40 synthase
VRWGWSRNGSHLREVLNSLRRFVLELSYDGSNYHGWQIQENAHTIQGAITDCIFQVLQKDVKLFGCGRTDTGVHASNYIAHFDVESIPLDLRVNLNRVLPIDICIECIYEVKESFHARFDATKRTYLYRVVKEKPIFNRHEVHWDRRSYDLNLMNQSCDLILNNLDFGAFCKVKSENKTNECNVSVAEWTHSEEGLLFTVVSNRFLRNMVRAMVGTMLELGRKKITLTDFEKILASKNRTYAGPSAPAKGLILSDIEYDRTEWVRVC